MAIKEDKNPVLQKYRHGAFNLNLVHSFGPSIPPSILRPSSVPVFASYCLAWPHGSMWLEGYGATLNAMPLSIIQQTGQHVCGLCCAVSVGTVVETLLVKRGGVECRASDIMGKKQNVSGKREHVLWLLALLWYLLVFKFIIFHSLKHAFIP